MSTEDAEADSRGVEAVDRVPMSAASEIIRAVARRDNQSFMSWREKLNRDSASQEIMPDLLYEVFRSAVVLRFANLEQGKQIDAFVERDRLPLWPELGFPKDKARRLLRSALGERGLVGDISTEEVTVIRLQSIAYLAEDMSMTSDQVDWLVSEAERWIAENR
jgi:hypothetical protein